MDKIRTYSFNKNTGNELRFNPDVHEWPVVYIINNKDEAYVGETVNIANRASQHWANADRKRLTEIRIITDEDYNKSVILDLENFLIKYMSADGKFKLQNGNTGLQNHRYYDKDKYESSFVDIWNQLKSVELAKQTIAQIENSDLFKYSPYKALTADQYEIVDQILATLAKTSDSDKGATMLVQGGAGTGKTVLAVYLVKLLSEMGRKEYEVDNEDYLEILQSEQNIEALKGMKIGLVVPMQSLRTTIKKVFKSIGGLTQSMVISPIEVPKEKYDLLIVDEAHRLRQRKALSQYPSFDHCNKKMGLDNSGTELDWILRSSRHQIFFYDSMQSVKPSDVPRDRFIALEKNRNVRKFELTSQLRCAGGEDYIRYVKDIFSENPPEKTKSFGGYDFKLFGDVEGMIEAVKAKDADMQLCRVVAGYAWKWISKHDDSLDDIEIDGHTYKWNTVNKDWINSPNSVNEIGCIHTTQGYDLNYAGVILGKEICYDKERDEIYIDKSNYYDLQGKTALEGETEAERNEALKDYIKNIYITLMTRGIKGTYVYVCNPELREYLSRFIPQE